MEMEFETDLSFDMIEINGKYSNINKKLKLLVFESLIFINFFTMEVYY